MSDGVEYSTFSADSLASMTVETLLNQRAAEGWRFAAFDGRNYIFERPRQAEASESSSSMPPDHYCPAGLRLARWEHNWDSGMALFHEDDTRCMHVQMFPDGQIGPIHTR